MIGLYFLWLVVKRLKHRGRNIRTGVLASTAPLHVGATQQECCWVPFVRCTCDGTCCVIIARKTSIFDLISLYTKSIIYACVCLGMTEFFTEQLLTVYVLNTFSLCSLYLPGLGLVGRIYIVMRPLALAPCVLPQISWPALQ